MKRVWSLCLALLLLVQMGLPVFADAGLAGQNSATGQLDPSAVYLEKENPDVGLANLESLPSDSGSTPVNSTVASDDSSSTPAGSGAVADDSDSTPVDSGVVADDSNSTPVNSGSVPDDSNSTPVDSGSVPDNSNSTPVDSDAVADDSNSTPVNSGSVPDDSNSTPVDSDAVLDGSNSVPMNSNEEEDNAVELLQQKAEGYATENGVLYYYLANGKKATGWFDNLNGARCYANSDGSIVAQLVHHNGYTYVVNSYGVKQTNGYVDAVDGNRYYAYGWGGVVTEKGWFTREDGARCYAGEGGAIKAQLVYHNGYTYVVDAYGVKQTNGYVNAVDGNRYYAYGWGGVVTEKGWFTREDGARCYAGEGGAIKAQLVHHNGYTYVVDAYGVKQTDGYVNAVDGNRYYAYGWGGVVTEKGWFTREDGARCYAGKGGVIKAQWVENGPYIYYVNSDGVKQTGYFTAADGNLYYAYSWGGAITTKGWFDREDGARCYAGDHGVIKAGMVNHNGYTYIVNAEGVKQVGLISMKDSGGRTCYYYASSQGILLTGWQTINNNRYYFYPADHAKAYQAAVGTVTINGVQYIFGADGKLKVGGDVKCIDVSAHQGYIDWEAVRSSGVEYAIIRAITWSGGSNGCWVEDAFFDYNVKHAKAAGIKVGAYIYTYAFSEQEVREEVAVFLQAANRLKSEGYTMDLPVFVDYEYPPILTTVTDKTARTNLLRYEMVLLDQAGYYPGMYMSTSWAQTHVDAPLLQAEGYDLWIADYRVYNGYGDSVVMWQYSSTGSVPGISGNVDLNYIYKDYSNLIHGSNNDTATESKWTVYDQGTGKNVTDHMENILAAIVNNEVGGTFLTGGDRTKLYQAQAVAAHSWLLYQYENSNTIPSVKLNYSGNYNTVKTAIAPVLNKVLYYDGRAANTVYTSCNNGQTNSSKDYWGSNLAYLTNVSSPYDLTLLQKYPNTGLVNYQNKKLTVTRERMLQSMRELFGANFSTTLPESEWIKITSRSSAGYVTGVTVCGQKVDIDKFYEIVYGCYSPAFNFTYSSSSKTWTFTSSGNGHCVGMSQYGAMGMIADGSSYPDVLAHYYPGTTLVTVM